MAEKTYVVTAACAVVRVGDRMRTVLQGGLLPPGADEEHIQVLLDRGIVVEGDAAGGIDVNPDAAPPFTVEDLEGESAKHRGGHAAKPEGESAKADA